jgi:Heavy metal binding domain
MKKTSVSFAFLFAGLFTIAVLAPSCTSKTAEEHHHAEGDSATHHKDMPMDSTQTAYACAMHPAVTGKEGDLCSKCGMKLEAVKSADSTRVN